MAGRWTSLQSIDWDESVLSILSLYRNLSESDFVLFAGEGGGLDAIYNDQAFGSD